MPDTPLEQLIGGPYDPRMEMRVSRLEDDMRDVKAAITRLETGQAEMRQALTRIETVFTSTLPHLATKADLADKPSKAYMWGILATLLTAYGCGLAALAVLK